MSWVIAVIMLLHGLIHLMGGLNELGLVHIKELSGGTLFPLPGWSHSIFGVAWFAAVVLFLLSVIGLVTARRWWKPITFSAIIVSQALIIIWWSDAKWGTLPNAIVLLYVLLK
ncbi:hypothetical protein [Sporolactobacillus pectinivorans]|uniref:hypothetical protein n=1 Tax=Sporolactobacillus pectinivorans TaxID=1591408 RepID=UPI000C2667E4|nr:hypothetical protein [Sporolactobacillus pectinivorans]